MTRRLIILGTCHALQCGDTTCSSTAVDNYRGTIQDICRTEKIRFIAEEMTEDALCERGIDHTVASSLVSDGHLNVTIDYVDIDRKLREQLGIEDYGLRKAAILPGKCQPSQRIEELLAQHISNPLRECSWLARMLIKDDWPVLLICGAEHVDDIATRARMICVDAKIAHRDYQP